MSICQGSMQYLYSSVSSVPLGKSVAPRDLPASSEVAWTISWEQKELQSVSHREVSCQAVVWGRIPNRRTGQWQIQRFSAIFAGVPSLGVPQVPEAFLWPQIHTSSVPLPVHPCPNTVAALITQSRRRAPGAPSVLLFHDLAVAPVSYRSTKG